MPHWECSAENISQTERIYRLYKIFDIVRIWDWSSDSMLSNSLSIFSFIFNSFGKVRASFIFRKVEKNSIHMCFFRYLRVDKQIRLKYNALKMAVLCLIRLIVLTGAIFVWFHTGPFSSPFAYNHRIAWHEQYRPRRKRRFDTTIDDLPAFQDRWIHPFESPTQIPSKNTHKLNQIHCPPRMNRKLPSWIECLVQKTAYQWHIQSQSISTLAHVSWDSVWNWRKLREQQVKLISVSMPLCI